MPMNGFSFRIRYDLQQKKLRSKDLAKELNISPAMLTYELNNQAIRLSTMIEINRAMMKLCGVTYSIEDFADILGEY